MPVLWFMEYEIPQDEEAKKKYLRYIFDKEYSCMVMDKCEKMGVQHQVWVDDSAHIIFTIEFETMEQYGELDNDPEWQIGLENLKNLVLNANFRLMRPAGE